MWKNRLKDHIGNDCLVSVDGVDCKMPNLKPFWDGWYSQKYNGAGIRWEVGVCIRTGEIVWIHGPFCPGRWNDLEIFRHSMKFHLHGGERVEADKGYVGEFPTTVKVYGSWVGSDVKRKEVGGRHETANKRLKDWSCLKKVLRHSILQHSSMFRAVAVLTQLRLESGEPLFSVDYDDKEHY